MSDAEINAANPTPELTSLNGDSGFRLHQLLVATAKGLPGVQSICDLGCGNGFLAHQLSELGARVHGVEGSPGYLKTARTHYASDRVTFTEAWIDERLAVTLAPQGLFDLVVSCDVIEHMYKPSDMVSTAMRILKPGGTVMISTPYHGYAKNLALCVLNEWDQHHGVHWNGGHIKFFSEKTLTAMLAEGGFTDIRYRHYGRIAYLWKNMIAVATKPR